MPSNNTNHLLNSMKPKNSVNINQRDRSKRKMKDNDEEFEELYLNKTYVTIRGK